MPLVHAPRRSTACLVLVLIGLASHAHAQAPVATTAADVRRSIESGTADARPVRLRGTVTVADSERGLLIVQDSTGGIVVTPQAATPVAAGQAVEVTGRPGIGTRGPALLEASLTVIGEGTTPAPRLLSWEAFQGGALDGLVVSARGAVRRLQPAIGAFSLAIASDGGSIHVDLGANVAEDATRVDAIIEVVGVVVPIMAERGSTIEREIVVDRSSPVTVVTPAPPDPFAAPAIAIAALPPAPGPESAVRRVRIRGIVTRQRPGRSLYLRDDSGSAYIETDSNVPVTPGDVVDVLGFPAVDDFAPYLADAEFRRVGAGTPPQPVDASVVELASGRLDAALVRTEAVVIGVEPGREELTLVLQDPGLIFNAHLLLSRAGTVADTLQRGARVRVTGICSVVVDSDRVPRSFRILLRDAADIEVLDSAGTSTEGTSPLIPWIAAAIAAAALGFAGFQYRRVAAQERTIRRQLAREASLKARFDDVFERTSDLIIVHDRRGRIATVNRSAEQLSGYAREELRPLDPDWILSATYIDEIKRQIADGPEAPPRTFRAELITRRNARLPIEVHTRVAASDGQVSGITAIARNLSERDQLDAQLRQAQKMEAVGRLATGIAHDFNNLITVLLGYSDELLEKIGPESDLYQPAREIQHAAERASALTEQLLSFSRRQTVTPQTVDLNTSVAGMHDLLKRLLGVEITLEVDLDPGLGLVRVDQAQVGQILMNLAVNARDAMPHGGRLTISTANVELGDDEIDAIPGPHVMLAVGDTGVGMSPDVQRRLFEPFFTTKDVGQGTGLGMSMVQAIVRQSGGHIAVSSEPGHGTTFRIYFPRVRPEDVPEQTPVEHPRRQPEPAAGVVLLTEDDPAVRRLVAKELRRAGFSVLEAGDGIEALETCRTHTGPIDLVVTDIVMPRMTGVELSEKLADVKPGVPVLFVTGHPERAGKGPDLRRLDPARVVLKPFTIDELLERIGTILAAARRP